VGGVDLSARRRRGILLLLILLILILIIVITIITVTIILLLFLPNVIPQWGARASFTAPTTIGDGTSPKRCSPRVWSAIAKGPAQKGGRGDGGYILGPGFNLRLPERRNNVW